MRGGWATNTARMVAAATALLATSLLVGCAALGIPHRTSDPEPAARTGAPAPTAQSEPAPALVPVADGTVAAIGTFSGAVSGTVDVVRDGSRYRLDFTGLRLPDGRGYVADLLSEPPATAECSGAYWAYEVGELKPSMGLHADVATFLADPSYLDGVQLRPNWTGWQNDYPSCQPEPGGYPIVAYAKLDWSLPDLRPDLAPADSGTRPGAAGAVKKGPTGILSQYWIEAGDTYADIADRFGITRPTSAT